MTARIAQRDVEIEFDVAEGEVVALLGPNGAGKSTLLDLIAGLATPDTGKITLGADVVTDTARGIHVPPHARGVASLSQSALLFPHLSVAENVAFAPRSRGGRGRAGDEHRVDVPWMWGHDVPARVLEMWAAETDGGGGAGFEAVAS